MRFRKKTGPEKGGAPARTEMESAGRIFNPDGPFAEGVRGDERFYLQDGFVFDLSSRRCRGRIDG